MSEPKLLSDKGLQFLKTKGYLNEHEAAEVFKDYDNMKNIIENQTKEIEALRKGGPLAKQLDTKLTIAKSKLELAVKALEEIADYSNPTGEDGREMKINAEITLEEIKRLGEGVNK